MDTSDEEITFEKGVCNYCRFAAEKANERRVLPLERPWLIHEIRKSKGKYNCLLGLSGGVDSSYTLHLLHEHKLRPLTYSVDNGWQTPEAQENIMRMVETLKVPFYRYTINLDEFRELQKAFIQSGTRNIEIPSDHLIYATQYELARKNKIKYIISGGNWQTEGTMPKSYGYQPRDLRHMKAIYKKFTGKKLKDTPTLSLPGYIYNRFVRRIKVVNLLDYHEYNRAQAQKLLQEKYGWKPYGEKHGENIYTKWFQNVYLPRVHGIDKRRPHLSSLIHSGQITRKQAVEELKKPLPEVKCPLGKFEVTPKRYTDYPNNEFLWNILSKIYGNLPHRR